MMRRRGAERARGARGVWSTRFARVAPALSGAALLLGAEPVLVPPSGAAPSFVAPLVATVTPRNAAIAYAAADATLVRDPELQAKIAAVAQATTAEQLDAALASLRASVAPDFADLVPQLALFLLDADGERAGMTPALIVSRLGVTRGQILRAVVPHLDTPEEKLRAQLENLLGAVELDDVRVYLTEQGGASPPDGLVRHLYARSPAGAVQVLRSASGAASAEPASVVEVERVRAAVAAGSASAEERAAATRTLDALARDPDWRLRAYAAAVLRTEPALGAVGGGETLARLAQDGEPRVRAVAGGPRVATTR